MAPRLPPGMAQSHVSVHACRFKSVASCHSQSFSARHPTTFANGWSFNAPTFIRVRHFYFTSLHFSCHSISHSHYFGRDSFCGTLVCAHFCTVLVETRFSRSPVLGRLLPSAFCLPVPHVWKSIQYFSSPNCSLSHQASHFDSRVTIPISKSRTKYCIYGKPY